MAAADYYNPGGGGMPQAAQQQQAPRPQQNLRPPGSQQSNGGLPYPISDAPPPYSAFEQGRPQSQPPPQRPYSPHVNFAPTNNYPPTQNGHMPEKQGYRPTGMQTPQNAYPSQPQYGSQYPQQQSTYPPQQQQSGQQGYPFPAGMTPAMAGAYSDPNRRTSTPGYKPASSPYRDDYDDNRSRSRSRSRSRDRRRRHHHHTDQPPQKKKSGVSTFLGAGGGALIGDAIFPGLGTLGGAILGGVGGREYAKQRRTYSSPSYARSKSYHSDRDQYDEEYDSRGRRRY